MNGKIFHYLAAMSKITLGFVVHYLGGWDLLLQTMLFLVVLDFVTGWVKAILNKELSSQIGFIGLLKKILMFIVVVVANCLQMVLKDTIPLRETIILFYCANEALSIVENISVYVPIPKILHKVLKQLKNETEIDTDAKDKTKIV